MAYYHEERFEWDPAKAARNRRKHGVSFADAVQLFTSSAPWADLALDEHEGDELRYAAIGASRVGILIVVYTERDDVTRIISARRATRRERRLYFEWIERHT